jgi:hypothetical protein
MRVRTNNFAPAVVGTALFLVLTPLLILLIYMVRAGIGGLRPLQWVLALLRFRRTAPGESKRLWDMLDEVSHVRLL